MQRRNHTRRAYCRNNKANRKRFGVTVLVYKIALAKVGVYKHNQRAYKVATVKGRVD